MLELKDPVIYRTVLETLQTGVYIVDCDQKIVFWNEGAEKITGYLRQDVVGCFCRDHIVNGGKNVLVDAADVITHVLRDGRAMVANVSIRHKAGYRVFVRLRGVPIRDSHGSIIGAAESIEEDLAASDWNRRQTKLDDYGCLDPPTGVLNQGFILSQLRESVSMFSEHRVPFSVLLVEIDRLGELRSQYGAAVISSVFRVVAQTLENSLRPTDFLGRRDERRFLAILTECSAAEIDKAAERLSRMVSASEVRWWGDELSVTASFGGSSVVHGDTTESLLERAEASLGKSLRRQSHLHRPGAHLA